MLLTRDQRVALKNVFDRQPLFMHVNPTAPHQLICRSDENAHPATYRQFRRTVQPYFGGDCIMVPWCGMWLGIETDGHTHS